MLVGRSRLHRRGETVGVSNVASTRVARPCSQPAARYGRVAPMHLRQPPIRAMGSVTWDRGGHGKMRAGFFVLATLLAALLGPRGALAQAQCSKADFEAVVDDAAGALRGLAQQNTPQFQAKLRQLKVKRGWTDDQLLKEAEPLVRDDRIAEFDERSAELLARITGGGQAGAAGDAPDCGLLAGLRASMAALVDTQRAKWTYMFDKIEQELRK